MICSSSMFQNVCFYCILKMFFSVFCIKEKNNTKKTNAKMLSAIVKDALPSKAFFGNVPYADNL